MFIVVVVLAVFDTMEKQKRDLGIKFEERVLFQFDRPEHREMLNTPTKPVGKLPDPKINALIQSMKSLMGFKLAGISANQAGKSLHLFLIVPPMVSASAPPTFIYKPGDYQSFQTENLLLAWLLERKRYNIWKNSYLA